MSSSTFYTTTGTFFSIDGIKKKGKRRYKGYSMKTTGEMIRDEEIEKLLVTIYENEDCNDPEYYIKALGDKKLSIVLKKRYGIIVNHKKIYRMRKELGLLRKYKKHAKHARERPKNHEVSERNKYWEADTKGLTIRTDNGPQFKSKATEVYISPFTKR